MSETLRDLVVSLSLQTDNFTRNIRSVQKQIAEAESQFRLAAAGVEGFEQSAEGLSTQLSTLERRLTLQQQAVTQYERALTAANDKLQECFTRQGDYTQRLIDARAAQEALRAQVAAAAQQVRTFSQTLGDSDSATIAARANLDALKTEYRASTQEVKKLAGQNTALQKSTQSAADAVSTANVNLNNARAAVRSTQAKITRCNQSLRLAQTNWDAAGRSIDESRAAIATFGKQIALAESRFKLATVGIKELDTSVTGLAAKQTLLTEKLDLQRRSLTQYEAALQGAQEQLKAAQQANDPGRIRQANDAVIDAETALNRAKTAVAATRVEIEKTNQLLATAKSAWTAAGKSLEDFGKKCDAIGKGLTTAGRALTTTVTTPVLALGATAIKASLDFESTFTSVRKTVDATEAEFDALAASSKAMSTQIAASTGEINEVMATAGQLGINKNYLADFSRTMIDLGNSTDIVADEAASTLAKFANITNMDQSLFGNLGATLVDLGNKFATTESSIMEMSLRLAAAGHQVGLSEAQILGFAAALSSVGIEAEMGGSAFSKALVKMEVAAATGGEALEDFARVSGLTAEGFKALFETDPAEAFQAFITGLSRMDEEGVSAIATLNDIGIAEVRLRDTLLRAVNANELFARTQDVAISAWQENTALTEEAGKRYATTESRLINLKNTAILFAQQLGDDLKPTIQRLIDGAGDLMKGFLDMDEAQRMQIIRMAAYAAAAGPVLLTLGKVTQGVGTLSTGIGKFATAVGKLADAGGERLVGVPFGTRQVSCRLAGSRRGFGGGHGRAGRLPLRREAGPRGAGGHERNREEVEGHRRRNLLRQKRRPVLFRHERKRLRTSDAVRAGVARRADQGLDGRRKGKRRDCIRMDGILQGPDGLHPRGAGRAQGRGGRKRLCGRIRPARGRHVHAGCAGRGACRSAQAPPEWLFLRCRPNSPAGAHRHAGGHRGQVQALPGGRGRL